MKERRRWLTLLLGLTLLRGLLYIAIIPPWQAPDENGHFEYAWLVAHLGRLPTQEDLSPTLERELVGSLYEWRYGVYTERALPVEMPARMDGLPASAFARRARTAPNQRFSLAYLWQALFLWPLRHQDLTVQLCAARLSSVLLNLLIVWTAWRIFEELLPQKRRLVAAMTAFVVFLPQHTFINASVGEGPLAEFSACVVLLGWLRLLHRGAQPRGILAVAGGTLVGMWTKHTVAFLLPFDVLALLLLLFVRLRDAVRQKRTGFLILGLLLAALAAGIGMRTPVGGFAWRHLADWWSDPGIHIENHRVSLDRALWQTFDSFWGQFGWMNVRVGPAWYVAIYILSAAAMEGWIWPRTRRWTIPRRSKTALGLTLSLAVAVWLGFMILTPRGLGFYQGRYLFPAAVPAAFLLVGGWSRLVPERWQRYAGLGVVTVLAALDAAAICLGVWPFFYA